jgi:hypothetical protein
VLLAVAVALVVAKVTHRVAARRPEMVVVVVVAVAAKPTAKVAKADAAGVAARLRLHQARRRPRRA